MKKYLFILATLLTFLFFSCASESESENEDDIIAPAVIEDTETDNASISEVEALLPSELLPEPEDFEEPLVRDLDIKDIPSLINEDKIIEEPIIETTKTTEEIEIENQENNNQPIELYSDSISSMQETQLETNKQQTQNPTENKVQDTKKIQLDTDKEPQLGKPIQIGGTLCKVTDFAEYQLEDRTNEVNKYIR